MIAIEFEDYVGRQVIVAFPDYLAIDFGGCRDINLYQISITETRASCSNLVIPQSDYLELRCC